jgi:hypothetical protein
MKYFTLGFLLILSTSFLSAQNYWQQEWRLEVFLVVVIVL